MSDLVKNLRESATEFAQGGICRDYDDVCRSGLQTGTCFCACAATDLRAAADRIEAQDKRVAAQDQALMSVKNGLTLTDYEEVFADHRRLVRELDVALNGDGAAKQASLCDIVGQAKHPTLGFRNRLERAEARIARLEAALKPFAKHANEYDGISDDYCPTCRVVSHRGVHSELMLTDFRRARSALKGDAE